MVTRVRAVQGYSSGITTELLNDTRARVNERYEKDSGKKIPAYYLGFAALCFDWSEEDEQAPTKIEMDMPGGVPKRFPDVTAHDTEHMHRDSIVKHGQVPGGFSRKTRHANNLHVLPDRLFDERFGRFAKWRNHSSHEGVAGKRAGYDCVILWSAHALLQSGVHFHLTPSGASATPKECSSASSLSGFGAPKNSLTRTRGVST